MSLPYPHLKQQEFMRSDARWKVLVWGRRTGKSMGVALYTMLRAIEQQGNYYIIAPTYKQAKSIYWKDILKVLVPQAIIKKTDEGELYIELDYADYDLETKDILGYDIHVSHNPDLPPSTIYLKGADNPDSLRGVKLKGAVLDEFAFFQYANDTWRKIIRPALVDDQGWAIVSSTPDGFNNSFYDMVATAQTAVAEGDDKWFYSHATMLDNVYIAHRVSEWAETRKEYERDGKLDEFTQEYEAQFTSPSLQVYRDFKMETHVINPRDVPQENMTYAIGMDFGLKDPFAVVFVAIDQNDNWYIYDEVYLPDLTIDKMARILHQKMGDKNYSRIIGDSAGAMEIASLRDKSLGDYRVWVTPSKKGKDSIRNGIREVSTKLYVRESTGKPKLFVSANCKSTIREFQEYKRLRDAWGVVSETPEDKNNHCVVGETEIWTTEGKKRIDSLVGTEGTLYSEQGKVRQFYDVRETGEHDIYRVEFDDGTYIEGTEYHPLYTDRGVLPLACIETGDLIQSVTYGRNHSLREKAELQREELLVWQRQILSSGIREEIVPITQGSMGVPQWSNTSSYDHQPQGLELAEQSDRKSGTYDYSGEPKVSVKASHRESQKAYSQSASTGEQVARFKRRFGIAQEDWQRLMGEEKMASQDMLSLRKRVRYAISDSLSILPPELQNERPTKKVVWQGRTGKKATTYNLEVEGTRTYILGNGLVSSNCMDALRYLVLDHMNTGKPVPFAEHQYNPTTGRMIS